jgi:AAA domain-containing protein
MGEDWSTDVIADVERWSAEAGDEGGAVIWSDLGAAEPREEGLPVLDGLLDGLRAAGTAPLAQALAERRLAGPPTSDAEAEGLVGSQVEAFRACLGPGVRMVWGPPGAGVSPVLARAIAALVADGKRVLLVAPSDTAVDDTLDAAVQLMEPAPGVVVRVGPAAERVGLEGVGLEGLAAGASGEVDEERAAVVAELEAIDAIDAEVESLRAELGDYDEPTYRAAVGRLAAEGELDELRPRLREAEAAADGARRAVVNAATELRDAVDAQAALGPVRDALEHERLAVAGLAALEQRQRALRDGRAALDGEERQSGWRARRQHRRQAVTADTELHRFAAAAADGRRRWLDVQLRARDAIGEHSQADVDAADQRAMAAERAVTSADEAYRSARELLIGLRRAVEDAEAWGAPTEEDRRLIARRLLSRQARLRELAARQDGSSERRAALVARQRELDERVRALRADAEARIVGEAGVVATTFARSRVHPALREAEFDAVLVEGAGGAALAEVLLVLCRATATAVLFGESRQVGLTTSFSHLGIESPADADAREGCVALRDAGIPEQRHDSPTPERS